MFWLWPRYGSSWMSWTKRKFPNPLFFPLFSLSPPPPPFFPPSFLACWWCNTSRATWNGCALLEESMKLCSRFLYTNLKIVTTMTVPRKFKMTVPDIFWICYEGSVFNYLGVIYTNVFRPRNILDWPTMMTKPPKTKAYNISHLYQQLHRCVNTFKLPPSLSDSFAKNGSKPALQNYWIREKKWNWSSRICVLCFFVCITGIQ